MPKASTKILARDGSLLYEMAGSSQGSRTLVKLADLPDSLKQAVASTTGRDLPRYLVRNLFFSGCSRSWLEKGRELVAGTYWSLIHSSDQTLETYLNTAYFGNNAYGVEAAAQKYFHKPARELNAAESFLLARVSQAPGAYDPYRHLAAAADGRQDILSDLTIFPPSQEMKAPHFVQRVIGELTDQLPDFASGGYTVVTTLDPSLQKTAENVVSRRLSRLADHNANDAAVMALDVHTGQILAYVGSADFSNVDIAGQVDMVAAKRQPGSALKPFLYFLAFLRNAATPATLIADLPVRFESADGRPYYPRNYNFRYYGPVTARDALGSSLNIPAVKLLDQVGLPLFMTEIKRFGLDLPEPAEHYGLSVILGGAESTLFDVASAYADLARGGSVLPVSDILEVRSQETGVRSQETGKQTPIFDEAAKAEQAAYLVSDILSDKAARSRAFGETSMMDVGARVAVKTGTTSDFRDNWAFGYTPDLVLGVWVGNADGSPMNGVTGVSGAVPIWHDIMMTWLGKRPVVWPRPAGIVERDICATSGLLANDVCPKTRRELFIAGSEPVKIDDWYVRCDGGVYLNPPAEYAAWVAAGKTQAPPASCVSSTDQTKRIIAPLDKEVFELDHNVAAANQGIAFTSAGLPPYRWRLNDRLIESPDAVYLWTPRPGSYRLTLEGSSSTVSFIVK